ncbi:uncharacterized protein LOC109836067 [Asparagus officinalis]|uniref:uncharacterized protein LOC109836067 n=1 Tax=Asparagus officinalis TaxID=4686 RepID=UPI00098E7BB6|nr:uncharacterized protein LOC109836067 [Asparagus officinalis]
MAKSKDDIKYGVAQAKLSEDESLRVRYKHGTPLEGGKIADTEPVDLFSAARRVSEANPDAKRDADKDQEQFEKSRARSEEAATSHGDGGGI